MKKINRIAKTMLAFMLAIAVCAAFAPVSANAATKTSLSKCKITLKYSIYTYTGKARKPAVTIKYKDKTLTKGKSYKTSYSNCKYPGTATIKITGMGKYKGTVKKTFKIRVGSVDNLTAKYVGGENTDKDAYIKLDWDPPKKCSYYKVTVTKDGKSFGKGTYNKIKDSNFTLKNLGEKGQFDFDVVAYGGGSKKKASKTESISVYAGKTNQNIETGSSSYTCKIGGSSFNVKAKAKTSLTYSSSNTSIIKVDDDGNVTPVSTGSADVKIKAASNSSYNSATKNVTVKVENIDKPSASSEANSCRRNTVKWNSVEGADGYYVYETLSGSTKTYTIKDGDATEYDIIDRAVGSKYSYTVEAYVKVGDTTFKSGKSSSTSCTAKPSKIGHAMSNRGNPAAGDQDGKEVTTSNWVYSSSSDSWKKWGYVIRFKDSGNAEKLAQTMEAACSNNKIGYDNKKEPPLNDYIAAAGYDMSKVKTNCETDCNCLVATCVNCVFASKKVTQYGDWSKNVNAFVKTNSFTVYTDKEYVSSDKYLRRGDILMTNNPSRNHACIVL
ncbi:MAG: hypothetical protein PUB09_06680 [Firmicutes bacterium]|nr:hypothetical protein [Bacillota bacterium]